MSWVAEEFSATKLGDLRLDKRLQSMMENFSKNPAGSISECSGVWKESMAAYRFFNNKAVTQEKVTASHVAATRRRISKLATVLMAHDTSSTNYSGHEETTGLGKIGDSKSGDIGLIMHSSIAFTEEGQSLGVLNQEIYARTESEYKNSVDRAKTPIEQKESYRWIEGFKQVEEKLAGIETRIIHLCDREGDIYELFCSAKEYWTDFIIRCKENRRINKKSRGSKDGILLQDALHNSAALGIHYVEVSQRKGPPRTARCEVRAIYYKLTMPRNKSGIDHNLDECVYLSAVSIEEVGYDGKDKISWTLISSDPVKSFEEAIVCANRYCKRWQIEVFHRNLKTGCKVESCGLNRAGKLKIFIALMSIIAWRMHWTAWINRIAPKLPASVAFSTTEIKILSLKILKRIEPNLTLGEAIICLAKIGGYLGRKNDPPPGPLVLARGWVKLMQSVEDYSLLELMYKC